MSNNLLITNGLGEHNLLVTLGLGTNDVAAIGKVRSLDERSMDVFFVDPVKEIDAMRVENYTISGGVQVLAVEKITDFVYRIYTEPQSRVTSYTLTTNNIRSEEE